MQMENIFNKIRIPSDYLFDINLEWDLFKYLDENLDKENVILLGWDLETELKINANGKYIY
jgi:hypothetical protein